MKKYALTVSSAVVTGISSAILAVWSVILVFSTNVGGDTSFYAKLIVAMLCALLGIMFGFGCYNLLSIAKKEYLEARWSIIFLAIIDIVAVIDLFTLTVEDFTSVWTNILIIALLISFAASFVFILYDALFVYASLAQRKDNFDFNKRLKEYAKLRKKNRITDEEYLVLKKKLIEEELSSQEKNKKWIKGE